MRYSEIYNIVFNFHKSHIDGKGADKALVKILTEHKDDEHVLYLSCLLKECYDEILRSNKRT